MSIRTLGVALAAASVLVAWRPAIASDALSVSVAVSEQQVLVGESVTLQVRSVSRVEGDIQVEVPRVAGLVERSRSASEGTSISWSSRSKQQITREQTLTIELLAKRAGTLTIPPIVARAGRAEAKSRPITLIVLGQEALEKAASKLEAGRVEPPDATERDIFVRYRLDKSSAFLGEQVLLDLELFAAPNGNFNLSEVPAPPELDGFWKEIVWKPKRYKARTTEVIGGRRFRVYRLWRVALFGLTAGERTLPPLRLGFSAGGGFFNTGRTSRVRTKPVRLSIEALPTDGRPRGFVSTNVGEYRLRAQVDATSVPAGKAVVLEVSLAGRGNIENVKLPTVPALDGFRAFPPNSKAAPVSDVNGVRGTKVIETLLMPTRGGRLEIPSLSLPTFDPIRGEYVTLTTDSIRVVVQGEPTAPADAPSVPAPPASKRLSKLRPIDVRPELTGWSAPPFRRPEFFAALVTPPALFAIFLLFQSWRTAPRRPNRKVLRRRVAADARARLSRAADRLDAGDLAAAYAAFVDALFTLGSERLSVPLQGLTSQQVAAALSEAGAGPELVDAVRAELETADYARFAPSALAGASAEQLLERWSDIMTNVERLDAKERA